MKQRIYKTEQRLTIAIAAARGNHPRDFRDAVHETSHVIDLGLEDSEDWDRELIHRRLAAKSVRTRIASECLARATERLASERAHLPYNIEHWAMMAAMEAIKQRIDVNLENWMKGIEVAYTSRAGTQLDRVRGLVQRLHKVRVR